MAFATGVERCSPDSREMVRPILPPGWRRCAGCRCPPRGTRECPGSGRCSSRSVPRSPDPTPKPQGPRRRPRTGSRSRLVRWAPGRSCPSGTSSSQRWASAGPVCRHGTGADLALPRGTGSEQAHSRQLALREFQCFEARAVRARNLESGTVESGPNCSHPVLRDGTRPSCARHAGAAGPGSPGAAAGRTAAERGGHRRGPPARPRTTDRCGTPATCAARQFRLLITRMSAQARTEKVVARSRARHTDRRPTVAPPASPDPQRRRRSVADYFEDDEHDRAGEERDALDLTRRLVQRFGTVQVPLKGESEPSLKTERE